MMDIKGIVDEFLSTPLAYVLARIRRLTGILPAECDHPYETWNFPRMVCGKCGATRQDIIIADERRKNGNQQARA